MGESVFVKFHSYVDVIYLIRNKIKKVKFLNSIAFHIIIIIKIMINIKKLTMNTSSLVLINFFFSFFPYPFTLLKFPHIILLEPVRT
jgi:hypothetical protein